MKDLLGRKLEVGDSVIFIRPHYRELVLGRIDSFTAQKVRVLTGLGSWNNKPNTLLQAPTQLAKVDGPALTMYLVKNSG